jgi:hypothetical protein
MRSSRLGKKVVVYRGERLPERPMTPRIGRYESFRKLRRSDRLKKERDILRLFNVTKREVGTRLRPDRLSALRRDGGMETKRM